VKSPPERNAREIVVVKARQVVASVAKLKFFNGEVARRWLSVRWRVLSVGGESAKLSLSREVVLAPKDMNAARVEGVVHQCSPSIQWISWYGTAGARVSHQRVPTITDWWWNIKFLWWWCWRAALG